MAIWRWALLTVLVMLGLACGEETLEQRSAAIRTSLHYDSAVPGLVEELCRLYAAEKRQSELTGIYEAHVANYPADKGAGCVLLRIYQCFGSEQGKIWARTLAARFPADPYALELAFETLRDPSLLAESIHLEPQPGRRMDRMRRLLEEPVRAEDRERGGKLLAEVTGALRPEQADWQGFARAALNAGYSSEVIAWLSAWEKALPEGAPLLDCELLLARAEEGAGRKAEAEERLRKALAKVEPGAPQRESILGALFSLLKDANRLDDEAGKLRERTSGNPDDAGLVMDLGLWLRQMGREKDAAEALRQASLRLPQDAALEGKALEILSEDELPDYLREKLALAGAADRPDLRGRLARLLFSRGAIDEAWKEWEKAESALAPGERATERMRLARELKTSGRCKESMRILESVVRDDPARIEARWELAEFRKALDDLAGAREILEGVVQDGLTQEQVLTHADRLLDEQLWRVAARWLDAAKSRWGDIPELASRRLRLLAAEGGQTEGLALLETMRKAAVTVEAYQDWLKSAWRFHADRGEERRFFQEEKARLLAEDRTADSMSRFLALCEMAKEKGARDEVIGWLRSRLDTGKESTGEELIRRLLIRVLGTDEAHVLEVESQLKWLLERPGVARDEDRARLAELYARGNRPDLARTLLGAVQVDQIREAEACEAGAKTGEKLGDSVVAERMLSRWTVIASTKSEPWEARLRFLRKRGREEEYRQTLQECEQARLEDADRLTLDQLRSWWQESALRSLTSWYLEGRESEARLLRMECRRRAGKKGSGWVGWMERLWLGEDSWKGVLPSGAWIDFPGGWRLGSGEAGTALQWAAGVREGGKDEPWLFPEKLRTRWVYRPGTRVVAGERAAGNVLLLLDSKGGLHAVDLVTGKLSWMRMPEEYGAQGAEEDSLSRGGGVALLLKSGDHLFRMSTDGRIVPDAHQRSGELGGAGAGLVAVGDVVVLASGRELVGLKTRDGQPCWRFRLSSPADGRDLLVLGARAGAVIAFDPASKRLGSVDATTGKLRWTVETEDDVRDAALDGDAVVLRGASGESEFWQIRNGTNGAVVWEGRETKPVGGALRVFGGLICSDRAAGWDLKPVRFPLVTRNVAVDGAPVGAANGAAVFWGTTGVRIVDGGFGGIRKMDPDPGKLVSALLTGGRLVTVERKGYSIWSLPTGARLFAAEWPAGVEAWQLASGTLDWRGSSVFRRTWTDLGPVATPVTPLGGIEPESWWMVVGDQVVCWEGADRDGKGN